MIVRLFMLRPPAQIRFLIALAYTSVMLLSTSAYAQSPAQPTSPNHEITTTQEPGLSDPPKRVVSEDPKPNDLKTEVETLKAENAAVRELLRKMADQQKTLLEQVELLQRRLDSGTVADASTKGQAQGTLVADDKASTNSGSASAAPPPVAPPQKEDRYQDGIVIYQNSDDAKVPFLLKFNVNTQVRYLNTQNSKETFTDHLGVVREVHSRNDITVNRTMFILGGYMFSKKLQYSMTVWTSAGAASIVVAGNVGWRFNKALTVTGGYTGVPGSRSLVGTFPFFQTIDRSMADNFFRPGFTQGVWANGEPIKGLNYLVFVGNGLNTLNVSANKIDTSLVVSGSTWWEPLGAYSEPGKSRQMYDDYFGLKKTRI